MISISEALAIIKRNIPPPDTENCSLLQALDRYLTEDIHAPEASPRYTGSAMDGYAVRWQDVWSATPATPVTLFIVGESRAGAPFAGSIQQGQAIRISTGAMLPDDADSVIRVEKTTEKDHRMRVLSVHKKVTTSGSRGRNFPREPCSFTKGHGFQHRRLPCWQRSGLRPLRSSNPARLPYWSPGMNLRLLDG